MLDFLHCGFPAAGFLFLLNGFNMYRVLRFQRQLSFKLNIQKQVEFFLNQVGQGFIQLSRQQQLMASVGQGYIKRVLLNPGGGSLKTAVNAGIPPFQLCGQAGKIVRRKALFRKPGANDRSSHLQRRIQQQLFRVKQLFPLHRLREKHGDFQKPPLPLYLDGAHFSLPHRIGEGSTVDLFFK